MSPPPGLLIAPRRRRVRRRRNLVRDLVMLNLTPMLDVVFNILLFLIVVTRFSTPEGLLPARLPAMSAAASPLEIPRTPVRLYLSGDPDRAGACLVRIDDRDADPVAPGGLIDALRERLARPGYDARTPVYIASDDAVAWDHVVNAYNAALSASFVRIYFLRS